MHEDDEPRGGEPEWADPVTVLASSDPALIAVAKSLLEDAEIPFVATGESIQDLFGLGRIGGFNPLVGPVKIRVPRTFEEEARRILADIETETEHEED
jgi:hypothetical protein